MLCGAGFKKGEQGGAILIHQRWASGFNAFHAISGRICAVDINIGGNALRVIAVYMPHGGCDDTEVEGVYTQLASVVCGSRRIRRACILLGDWNAVVGARQAGDEEDTVGNHGGAGARNGRDEWLVNWASSQRLTIAATLFERRDDDSWTYRNGHVVRQLDYCLMDVGCHSWATDAGAADLIGVGADHRAIRLSLTLRLQQGAQKKGRGKESTYQTCEVGNLLMMKYTRATWISG